MIPISNAFPQTSRDGTRDLDIQSVPDAQFDQAYQDQAAAKREKQILNAAVSRTLSTFMVAPWRDRIATGACAGWMIARELRLVHGSASSRRSRG
jgi:hypothetical protein